jgi:hypothetical protein
MLPLRLQKLILGLSGRNRCETGQADGVKGTILVWPVRKIGDELISHVSASSLGRASNLPQLTPEKWSISLSFPRKAMLARQLSEESLRMFQESLIAGREEAADRC